jgi:hypothetical protein
MREKNIKPFNILLRHRHPFAFRPPFFSVRFITGYKISLRAELNGTFTEDIPACAQSRTDSLCKLQLSSYHLS